MGKDIENKDNVTGTLVRRKRCNKITIDRTPDGDAVITFDYHEMVKFDGSYGPTTPHPFRNRMYSQLIANYSKVVNGQTYTPAGVEEYLRQLADEIDIEDGG